MALIKLTHFAALNEQDTPTVEPVLGTRMARFHTEYIPEIGAYIQALKREVDYLYLLINALGGSEVWGDNHNGDDFPAHPAPIIVDGQPVENWGLVPGDPAKEDWGYGTFPRFAHIFRQHRNKISEGHPEYGHVLFSAWNPRMHRVELVARVRRNEPDIQDIVEPIEKGEPSCVSMGTRVPWDLCSVCNNRAKNTKEYCQHLRLQMRELLPNGTRIRAINFKPLFFDISFVRKGADPTAWVLENLTGEKVAAEPDRIILSAELGERVYGEKMAGEISGILENVGKDDDDKDSALTKKVPGYAVASEEADPAHAEAVRFFTQKIVPKLRETEKPMPDDLAGKLAAEYSLEEIWASLHAAGMVLLPVEFQKLALFQVGQEKLAREWEEQGLSRWTEFYSQMAAWVLFSKKRKEIPSAWHLYN